MHPSTTSAVARTEVQTIQDPRLNSPPVSASQEHALDVRKSNAMRYAELKSFSELLERLVRVGCCRGGGKQTCYKTFVALLIATAPVSQHP